MDLSVVAVSLSNYDWYLLILICNMRDFQIYDTIINISDNNILQ